MRRPGHRVFVAIGVSVGFLVYVQVVILIRGHSASSFPLQTDVASFLVAAEKSIKRQVPPNVGSQGTNHGLVHPVTKLYQSNITQENLSNLTEARMAPDVRNQTTLPFKFWESKFLEDYNSGIRFGRYPPRWQNELYKGVKSRSPPKDKYFLSHLLMVRLYSTDLAKWTLKELKQWMHYMFLIGVEHIYICDHYHQGDEDMEKQLQQYISLGLVSYTRVLTKRAMTAQVECYRKRVLFDGHKSRWMTSVDMDEYPYHMKDKEENFLHRYLKKVEQKHPRVAEVSMPNFLMLGQGDRTKNITIDRIRRSTPGPANKLVKPLFMPEFSYPDIHHGVLKGFKLHMDADSNELRMLHYWGSRLQEWGPDTDHVLNMTVPFTDMADTWSERIRNSLLMFGENDAFSSETGP